MNFVFSKFNLGRRIPVGVTKLKLGVFNELLEQGDVYVKELEDFESATKHAGARNAMAGSRKAEDTLKVKNPW